MNILDHNKYYQKIVDQLGLTDNQLFSLNIDHFTENEGPGRDQIILQYFGETGLASIIQATASEFENDLRQPPSSFLDLGTGSGSFFAPLVEELQPEIAAAFDATPLMLDLTEKKLDKYDGRFLKIFGDMEQITRTMEANREYSPEIPAQFDLILSTLALHHVPDTEKVLDGIASVLKPKGKAIIVDAILSDTSSMEPSPEHAHDGFEIGELEELATEYFETVEVRRLDVKCYETASKSGTELLMLVLQDPIVNHNEKSRSTVRFNFHI